MGSIYRLCFIMLILVSLGCCYKVPSDKSGENLPTTGLAAENDIANAFASALKGEIPDTGSIPERYEKIENIKKEINLKLNVGNEAVKDKGRNLTLEYPGDGTIEQISSIYDYMVSNWSYSPDTRGIEEFQYSNKSLEYGKGKYSGQGDCDDFSILLASLIESIGGTSRIVLAYGPMGGHAFAESYLGKAEGNDSDVSRMINWLKVHYNVQNINIHTDMDTRDVWLNLDWWKDPYTGVELAKHPGGPFFKATNYMIIPIRENIPLVALRPLNDPPVAEFKRSPYAPDAGEMVSFDASSSRDIGIGGKIESYIWDFGDGSNAIGINAAHFYTQGGKYPVNLTVVDNDGAENYSLQIIEVNSLPSPFINISPEEPLIMGQIVSFDATSSLDEDGAIENYEWDFGDKSYSDKACEQKVYSNEGNMTVNLTVTDDRGARNTTSRKISVWSISANISNIGQFSYVPRWFSILGDYAPDGLNKDIWIFVKPSDMEEYIPQLRDSGGKRSALMKNGKFEARVEAGNENDSSAQFSIIAALADEQASQSISLWSTCCDKKKGLDKLPMGVNEVDRVEVIRSREMYGEAPQLPRVNKSIKGGITRINNSDNTLVVDKDSLLKGNNFVDSYMNICGFISPDLKSTNIWILLYSPNGRWYPQSDNADINLYGHVNNCIFASVKEWRAKAWFGTGSGEPTRVVAVLADDHADRYLNDFQIKCSQTMNSNGQMGEYPGLMTIELPSGIEEIDSWPVIKRELHLVLHKG
ncbi:MAG: PKD domain protein [Methanosaeta sp. PtaU1.Bin112]|nr:MAG: PKD domain protein [Methanosaeta sp. PtaU1.Bin112]